MIALSNVSIRYGAPMGRSDTAPALAGKTRLQRVRLDSGGYDAGGAYWGHGEPLWVAEDVDGARKFFRARNRDAAKANLPECRFFR